MSFTEEITSERLNRRQFVKVAAGGTLGLAALLAGCGSSTGSSLNSNGSAAIEFLAVQQAGTGWPLVLSTITDQYAKTHAGTTFKVDFAGQTGLNQKVQLLAAQGALPVLYNTPPADLMAQLVKNGEGLDIESTFQQLGVYQELVNRRRSLSSRRSSMAGSSHSHSNSTSRGSGTISKSLRRTASSHQIRGTSWSRLLLACSRRASNRLARQGYRGGRSPA